MARVPHRTFYDVLGINQDANHDAIRTAYKRMSRQCHPDKNPGNGRAVAWQQEVSSQSSSTADQHIDKLFNSQVNKAYETLRDPKSRVTYDAKLPSQHNGRAPFTPQYTWVGFDGAWGMPSSVHWQPGGYYQFGRKTTVDDYWGGTRPWHETSSYDFKDSWEDQRQGKNQGWDYSYWHESQPSEPGSFSWTEDEESWKQAEEERRKAGKEREERADSERRRRKEKKRAERDKEQKRRDNARIPEQQKKASEKVIDLDEEIARLKATSRRSTLTGEAEEECRTDEEGSDTVDHFSIKLNRRRRALSEVVSLHCMLCRVQRANGQDAEAENAEQELAKARKVSAVRLAYELARDAEYQSAGHASLHGERLRMQLRQHIYDWLDQLIESEEHEAPGRHTASNIKHPDSRTRPTQASHHAVDDQSETLIPDQSPYPSPSKYSHNIIDSEPEPLILDLSPQPPPSQPTHTFIKGESKPLIPHLNQNVSSSLVSPTLVDLEPESLLPSLNADPLKPDTEASMPNYLQTVHNHHLQVHSEYWDFVAGDEVNCDFCGMVLPVLQCPHCDARACSECKTLRGERRYPDMRGWR